MWASGRCNSAKISSYHCRCIVTILSLYCYYCHYIVNEERKIDRDKYKVNRNIERDIEIDRERARLI